MKQAYILLFLSLTSFALLGQEVTTLEDCTAANAITIEDLSAAIEQDTPIVAGDTTFYCANAEVSTFVINNQPISEITVLSDSATMPFKAIVTDRSNGDAIDTLDESGESYIITEGDLYFLEVIGVSPGTGEIQTEVLGIFGALGLENDTTEVRVIAALPVVWGSPLDYRTDGKVNTFRWSVTEQYDVESYELQLKMNGRFETVEHLAPKVHLGAPLWYETTDATKQEDQYYRVRQTDYDGAVTYSNLLLVPGVKSPALSVYPNPVADIVKYNLPGGVADVRLFSTLGTMLRQNHSKLPTGEINVADLPGGIYLLSITDRNGARHVRRIRVL